MKKSLIALLLILCMILCGCSGNYNAQGGNYNAQAGADRSVNDGRMALIYNNGFVLIYEDTKTGVQYITRGGQSGICVMVNSDGTPYIEAGKE